MFSTVTVSRYLRSLALAIIMVLGMVVINVGHTGQALAADNYSAPTDTYQETRNPNRVTTTTDELANRKPEADKEEIKGESIYDRLVDKVNREQKSALQTQEPAKGSRS